MRLIDADKLMDYCQNLKERKIDCNDIARFPTAYDVDRVVEKLEEARSSVPVNRLLDDIIKDKPKELGMLIAYDDAIEIVKGGGNNE